MVNPASMMMSVKRVDTTDAVVRRPTPSAPPDVAKPCWQAMMAIASPKTTLLRRPEKTSHVVSAFCVSREIPAEGQAEAGQPHDDAAEHARRDPRAA